jgi:hypothetical protein
MKTRKVRIGITISISDPNESLFSNGIRQNIIILRELYEKCKNIEKSYIVNVTNVKIDPNSNSPLAPYAEHIIGLGEVPQKCDLLVVCHGSLLPEEYKTLNKLGIRVVKQALGSVLTVFNENILFKENDKAFGIFYRNRGNLKAVWMSEHFFERERYFHETINECDTKIAPYVWSPRFIEESSAQFLKENGVDTKYSPSGLKQKSISSFEPNINIVKCSTVPIIIIERFYRKYPQLLKMGHIFNGLQIKNKKDMIDFAKDLNCHKEGKLFFEGGFPIVGALKKHTDILLSHQENCALNYLYFDAAWLGYPVVHNSHMLKKLGWYYEGNDAEKAIKHLAKIANTFDDNYQNYLNNSRQFLQDYLPDNQKNINQYEKLIEEAMS